MVCSHSRGDDGEQGYFQPKALAADLLVKNPCFSSPSVHHPVNDCTNISESCTSGTAAKAVSVICTARPVMLEGDQKYWVYFRRLLGGWIIRSTLANLLIDVTSRKIQCYAIPATDSDLL